MQIDPNAPVGKPVRPRKPQRTDEFDTAMAVIERRAHAGESLGYVEIEREAGISSTAVRRALAAWDARQEQAADYATFLAASAQDKLEAAIRQRTRQLEAEFAGRVNVEARRLLDAHFLPLYGDTIAKAQTVLDAGKRELFPFSPSQYKAILAALHPDNSTSTEKRQELFQLFKSKEARLKNPIDVDARLAAAGIPRTVEEMLARRAELDAQRKAARAAKKKEAKP